MKKMLVTPAALTLSLAFVIGPAWAHHDESNNLVNLEPVAGSPSPNGAGTGLVYLNKDAAGVTDADDLWDASYVFASLEPCTRYTIAVRGGVGTDPNAFSGICTFVTDGHGDGMCLSHFKTLTNVRYQQLRLGNKNGVPVLEATLQKGESQPPGITLQSPRPPVTGDKCDRSEHERD